MTTALRRPNFTLLAALLAFVAALVIFAITSRGSTPIPAPPAAQDEGVGALGAAANTAARVAILQAAAQRHPSDPKIWSALGSAYYQRVRETGDFSYYKRAGAVLDRALQIKPDEESALIGQATVALARHDFRAGERWARRAERLSPQSTGWAAGLIDAQVELGQYAAAARTLTQFIARKPYLSSYARVSYFRELHGDLTGAVSAMSLAASASGDTPESVAYVQTLLGDLQFLRGRLAASERAYRLALSNVAAYPLASAGLAQVEAVSGQSAVAERRLRSTIQQLPLPQFVIQLGELELAHGQSVKARDDLALVDVERRLLTANGVNTEVDIARYEADHGKPARGLALARSAWAQAPSVRSADAVEWALTRSGRAREALGWARRALRLGSADPMFLYHAGMTAQAAGQPGLARARLTRALAGNPRFNPLYAPRAQRALKALR